MREIDRNLLRAHNARRRQSNSPVVVAIDKIQNFSTLLEAFWPRAGRGGQILR